MLFTTCTHSTRQGNVFTLLVHPQVEGYASLWSQVPSQPLVPCSFRGYPLVLSLVLSKVLFRSCLGVCSRQDRGYALSSQESEWCYAMGTPSTCLLWSCRRIVLLVSEETTVKHPMLTMYKKWVPKSAALPQPDTSATLHHRPHHSLKNEMLADLEDSSQVGLQISKCYFIPAPCPDCLKNECQKVPLYPNLAQVPLYPPP